MSPEQFWDLSLRELWNVRRAIGARAREAHDRDVALAWEIEAMSIRAMQRDGSRKTPDLKKYLQGGKRKGAQTHEERVAVMHALSARVGVPLQRMVKGPDGQYHPLH